MITDRSHQGARLDGTDGTDGMRVGMVVPFDLEISYRPYFNLSTYRCTVPFDLLLNPTD